MNIIIGQVATGDFFYKREKIIDNLWKIIQTGTNVLISGPRRIGKTSLMAYLKDNPLKGYQIIYLITESVNNKNEFYRKLVNEIISRLTSLNRFSSSLSRLSKSTTIKSIGSDGISFERRDIDYYEEFLNIIKLLDLKGEKLVFMIDEFAQTVENIMQDETEKNSINFLQSNRDLRNDPKINQKIQFIYAGSIGLENIVSYLNAVNTINDLYPFHIATLSPEEAIKYIREIALGDTKYKLSTESIKYLLGKIEWLIPYFINILLDETVTICNECGYRKISREIIDNAFLNALKKRSYFEHWHTRLRKAYKKDYYNFSKEVLNKLSEKGILGSNEIFDIAVSFNITEKYKDVLNSLIYDGYINNYDDPKQYRFNSPLLRTWWYNNVTC